MKKILVGTDTSASADLAVQAAAELTRASEAELLVVHVRGADSTRDAVDPSKSADPAGYLDAVPARDQMGSTVRSVGRGPRCTQTERPARIETVRGRDQGGPLGTCPSGTSLFTNELAAPVVRCRQDEMGKGTPVGGRQPLLCARPAAADAGPRAVGSGRIPRSRNATLPCGGELALRRVGLWLGPEVGLQTRSPSGSSR
jgi:Universal stress protein family